MSHLSRSRGAAWSGLLVAALLLVGACDVPTSGPSFQTETGLNTPVVVDKTFTFLGGPESRHEPLIDTTTSQFDSLFTVAESDQSLSIEEEVSSFDIGSLDQALDEATEGVGANTSISETVIQGNDLATQDVDVDQFTKRNGRAGPTPAPDPVTVRPIGNVTVPFPAGLLAIPDFQVASVNADTVRRGTLTPEESFEGTTVNQLTFTLRNDPFDTTPLTDGNGNGPTIRIEDSTGTVVASADFNDPIQSGDAPSLTVNMAGKSLGKESQLDLVVEGSEQDPEDELTVELSALRYQKATLEDNLEVDVTATENNLSTRGGSGSQFAGVETRSGTLQLEVTNNFQFPIRIDSLFLENDLQNAPALPDSFQTLDVLKSTGSIASGATQTLAVDLAERGIAKRIEIRVRGGLADDRNVLTAAASDNIEVSAGGSLTVGTMYFWPNGEEVQAGGTFDFEQDRISFDQQGDFVELSGGTLAFNDLVSEPTFDFENFTLSFPSIRRSPYGAGDSLTVNFSSPLKDKEIDLSDVQFSPTGNAVDYHLQGTLESVSQTPENLRVVRFADEVGTDVSVGNLDVRALEAGVEPFSVNVTDGLNLADTTEATRESFGDFGGIADQIDGLQLAGSELAFRVTTDVGTNTTLYAALQGRGGGSSTFLAGKGDKRVSPSDSLSDDFFEGNSSISSSNLIQFGIEGAPMDDPVTRSITLTDDNSTVDSFISTLPTSLRFVAKALLTGDDNGRIRLRRPLAFDTGLSVRIPVQIDNSFAVEDTIDADFSSLEDVTDPSKDVTVNTAELRVNYKNGLPLGADARLIVLNESDNEVLTLPGENESLRIEPAPKTSDGTAERRQSGKTVLTLSEEQLRDLSAGRRLRLRLTMNQVDDGGAATLRAVDTITLSLEAKVEASVSVE